MNKRQYYSLLVRSAKDATFPSQDDWGRPKYRGDNGARCPVGLLIPSSAYAKKMEGATVNCILSNVSVPEGMNELDLREIQICHDRPLVEGRTWTFYEFISEINRLDVFKDVKKVSPKS